MAVKIVDAVSSGAKPAPSGSGSLPVKIDTSGMADALKQMAENHMKQFQQSVASQAQQINPAEFVQGVSGRMADIYSRYEKLKLLGRALNGHGQSENLPDDLAVDNVAVTFRVKDESGKFGEPVVADIKNVALVGDLAGLLSTELGIIILTLQEEVTALEDIARKSKDQYARARKNWEEANPDRQIRPAAGSPAAGT